MVGIGNGELDTLAETVRRCGALIAKKAEKIGAKSVTVGQDLGGEASALGLGQALAEGLAMGAYHLKDFKSDGKKASLQRVSVIAEGEFRKGVSRGAVVGEANCLARRLQDTPPI